MVVAPPKRILPPLCRCSAAVQPQRAADSDFYRQTPRAPPAADPAHTHGRLQPTTATAAAAASSSSASNRACLVIGPRRAVSVIFVVVARRHRRHALPTATMAAAMEEEHIEEEAGPLLIQRLEVHTSLRQA